MPDTLSTSTLRLKPVAGLVLGLMAGAIIWGIVQSIHPVFRVSSKFDVPSIGLPPAMFAAHRAEQDRVDRLNAMLYVGGWGLCVAVALALGESMLRRSPLPSIAAPLGALGGAIGGRLACPVYEHVRATIGEAELTHAIGAQLLVGVPMGLAVGLGLGLSTRSLRGAVATALAGAAAGVLAAAVYPVVVSIAFPAASATALLPEEGPSRLLWFEILSGLIGLLIPIGSRQRVKRSIAADGVTAGGSAPGPPNVEGHVV